MKKIIKLLIGFIGFVLYFFLIDDSCIGIKKRLLKIKEWANK